MSKSYGNDISLSDSPETIRTKVRTMMTDPARKRRHDPGNPDICPVFSYHKIYSSQEIQATVQRDCRTARIGCVDCKKWMSDGLIRDLSPLLDRRQDYAGRRAEIGEIIQDGNRRAAQVAGETMQAVRQAMKMT
jgi:tryptophanyl-tRNA synthetase